MEIAVTRPRALVVAVLAALLALAGLVVARSAPAGADHEPALPIVFVHGFSGSGAQYETQALRFASNAYPNVVTAIDRTSTTPAVIYPILDDFFDDLMAETGAPQVYALGHSAGTAVMNGYLNSAPERAARVAKYIGIDGATAAACPGGVPCMGIWARGNPARALGPTNVQFPDQGHTEVVGSAESFVEQYRFFTGHDPATTLILPEPPGQVQIGGRALNFPANTGLAGTTVEVWEIDGTTGARKNTSPDASFAIGEDGNWGPARVNGQQHYELTVIRDDFTQHFYYEPFIRSNSLVRLLLSPPDSALSQAIERGPNHGAVVIQRQKEWWGENPNGPVDTLEATTSSASGGEQPPVSIVNGATAPFSASTIAIITFDAGSDGVSNTGALLPLGPFLSGVDVYYPASIPPDGTITFAHSQRGAGSPQVINSANWASEGNGVTVSFRNWTQDINTWGDCMRARPSPCR